MNDNIPNSVVLNAAVDLMQVFGWDRGGTRNSCVAEIAAEHEGYCLEGAIAAASGRGTYWPSESYTCPASSAVREYLGGQSPFMWNDAQKSIEPVIEVLRAVAVLEAAKESAAVQVPAEVVA